MRITLVGAMKTNAGWCTTLWIWKALEAMGHEVTPIDFRTSDINEIPTNSDLLLGWKASGVNVEHVKGKKVLWYPDDFSTPWAQKDYSSEFIQHYDKIYTPIKENLPEVKAGLELDVSFLPPGVDVKTFRKMDNELRDKQIDVCFVGSTDENVYPERKYFLDYLIHSMPYLRLWIGKAHIETMVNIFNYSKIVLNIGYSQRGFQLRILEGMSTGSFMLTNECESVEELSNGKKVLGIYNDENLKAQIEYYIDQGNEGEREEIAKAGLEEVRSHHTWENRIKTIIDEVM